MSFKNRLSRSWWVILSLIFMINGFGFLYISLKHNNKNWFIEGLMYEIPWIFFVAYVNYAPAVDLLFNFAVIIMIVSIVRSIWVAVKLNDVYKNEEKYSVRPTAIKNHNKPKENKGSSALTCCLCIIIIFCAFVIFAL